jgi:diacylglycerol O-acyltransferase / wax synthase
MSRARPHGSRTVIERLTALDASNLRVEDRGQPMHVAALAFLDAAPLLDSTGRLRLDSLRRHVERRTHHARRLRQVLGWPSRHGLGPPFWYDDPQFEIARHVRTRAVPRPGDEDSLLALCCELNEPPLDRSRPLWEMWLLTGLRDDRIGLLIRFHHVLADGIAALDLLGSLFDPIPHPTVAPSPPETPRPRPGSWALLSSNLRDRGNAARHAVLALAHPIRLARGPVGAIRQARSIARLGRAPLISLNRPVGAHRRLMLVRSDLVATKAIAHQHHAKVNDVALAAVAGGARRLLETRGELTSDLVLKVSVAASIRRPDDPRSGNRVGIRVVPIPVGDPDAVRRLERIATVTAAQRVRPPYQPGGRLLQPWMVRVMSRQRMVNLLVSNLPGPAVPMYFCGSEVLEVFQIGTVQGNLALSVCLLSYAGQLNIDVVGDADVVPDIDLFTKGIIESLSNLGVSAQHTFNTAVPDH